MAKHIIFTMNAGKRKISGKKTSDSHYYNWNGNRFIRCRKSDIKGIECIKLNFSK